MIQAIASMTTTNQRPSKSDSLRLLLFGGNWDFMAPFSLEECIERIKARAERKSSLARLFSNERLNTMIIDDNTFMLKVALSGRGASFASAYALLDRQEGDTTAVEVETRTNLLVYIPLAAIIVLMAIGPFVSDTSRFNARYMSVENWLPGLGFFFIAELVLWMVVAHERLAAVNVIRGLLKDSSLR